MRGPKSLLGCAAMAVLALGWLVLAPTSLGGSTTYVTTRGNSMEPSFHTGDLALVREADQYRVGDAVAYHSDQLDTVVLHRIVAVDAGRYTFQGDNNTWLDPERPTERQLIGELALRIPQGGIWLARLTSPTALGLLAYALVAAGGAATATRRRNRRNKRSTTVSTHAFRGSRGSRSLAPGSLPPRLSAVSMSAAALGLVGIVLGGFAWTSPATETTTERVPSGRAVTFSYTADVPLTPAYDTTTVESPDPVFRKLAHAVDIAYTYWGEPGSVSVSADLSAPNGWRASLPLAPREEFTGDKYAAQVTLDLDALDRKTQRAAEAIGVPIDQITVAVRPRFLTSSEAIFAPELQLLLTPTTLSVADASALTVADNTTKPVNKDQPRMLRLGGQKITVDTARIASAALVLAALLINLLVRLLGRWTAPSSEGAAIRQRHAANLVRVEPMTMPPHRPVIDVGDFDTLAKIAERYGLLVLHWTRTDVETFLVQDEGATYRYRTRTDVQTDPGNPNQVSVGYGNEQSTG